jgi:hypothetical protein
VISCVLDFLSLPRLPRFVPYIVLAGWGIHASMFLNIFKLVVMGIGIYVRHVRAVGTVNPGVLPLLLCLVGIYIYQSIPT